MRTSKIAKTLGVLALLGSSTGMAATVNITPSAGIVTPGQTFTLTISADTPNTFAATMALAFDATKVAFVSGAALAPWNVFVKNSPVTANPTVFDVETPSATANPSAVYNVALLTFNVLANATSGSAGIVINDDGGNNTGWFDADTADWIPVSYNQATVNVEAAVVPAPATLGLLATGLAGLAMRARRKRAA